jgi:CheY-like chemotaxis protein
MTDSAATPRIPILVVEDDEDIRTSLVQVLEDEGYAVSSAQNGRVALNVLAALEGNVRPRLILLDLMMPVLDGRGFMEEQARVPDLSRIPVLILSASGTAESTPRPANLSTAILKKPFTLDRLLTMVQTMCATSG